MIEVITSPPHLAGSVVTGARKDLTTIPPAAWLILDRLHPEFGEPIAVAEDYVKTAHMLPGELATFRADLERATVEEPPKAERPPTPISVFDGPASPAPPAGTPLIVRIFYGPASRVTASLLAVAETDPFAPSVWVMGDYAPDGLTTTRDDARGIVAMLIRCGISWRDVDHWIGVSDGPIASSTRKSNAALREALAGEVRATAGEFPRIITPHRYCGIRSGDFWWVECADVAQDPRAKTPTPGPGSTAEVQADKVRRAGDIASARIRGTVSALEAVAKAPNPLMGAVGAIAAELSAEAEVWRIRSAAPPSFREQIVGQPDQPRRAPIKFRGSRNLYLRCLVRRLTSDALTNIQKGDLDALVLWEQARQEEDRRAGRPDVWTVLNAWDARDDAPDPVPGERIGGPLPAQEGDRVLPGEPSVTFHPARLNELIKAARREGETAGVQKAGQEAEELRRQIQRICVHLNPRRGESLEDAARRVVGRDEMRATLANVEAATGEVLRGSGDEGRDACYRIAGVYKERDEARAADTQTRGVVMDLVGILGMGANETLQDTARRVVRERDEAKAAFEAEAMARVELAILGGHRRMDALEDQNTLTAYVKRTGNTVTVAPGPGCGGVMITVSNPNHKDNANE